MYFNSHPHKEDDLSLSSNGRFRNCHFNSHPRKEDDGGTLRIGGVSDISTHILARRMTIVPVKIGGFEIISTHILARRMTRRNRSDESGTNISTHILARRMTAILNKNNLFKITYYINNKHFISIVDIFFHFHIYF